jgi:hypothetical protein
MRHCGVVCPFTAMGYHHIAEPFAMVQCFVCTFGITGSSVHKDSQGRPRPWGLAGLPVCHFPLNGWYQMQEYAVILRAGSSTLGWSLFIRRSDAVKGLRASVY